MKPGSGSKSRTTPALLFVTAGGARSDVLVNGRLVGKTPFMGNINCEKDKDVTIEILPPKGGKPQRHVVACSAEIRVQQ